MSLKIAALYLFHNLLSTPPPPLHNLHLFLITLPPICSDHPSPDLLETTLKLYLLILFTPLRVICSCKMQQIITRYVSIRIYKILLNPTDLVFFIEYVFFVNLSSSLKFNPSKYILILLTTVKSQLNPF